MARPLTWDEYLQLQGLYAQVMHHTREQDRYEQAAARVLAVTQDLKQVASHTSTAEDEALEIIREGYSYRDWDSTLDELLARFDVEIPDAPDPAPVPPTSATVLWDALQEVLDAARAPLDHGATPMNRLVGIAETARRALGEPDADE